MHLNFDNWPALTAERDDGLGQRTLVNTVDAQTLTNKTLTSPTITTPAISSPVISGGLTGPRPVVTPTGAGAITAAMSGSDIMLNAAAGFALTLPAPAAGLNYRITVAAAFATTSFTVVTNGGANIIQGGATVVGADVPAADEDTITFVNSAENKGDFVELWSDGTSWFVNGRGTTVGSITFTAT